MAILKHCPFCGSERTRVATDSDGSHGGGRRSFYVRCEACWARGPATIESGTDSDEQLKTRAAAAWNRWHERTKP